MLDIQVMGTTLKCESDVKIKDGYIYSGDKVFKIPDESITIMGTVTNLDIHSSSTVIITGSVNTCNVHDGDLHCNDVGSKVSVLKGDVHCDSVGGNVSVGKGHVKCDDIGGNANVGEGFIQCDSVTKTTIGTNISNIHV